MLQFTIQLEVTIARKVLPIINIEIDNNTLYVLIYFISKCLDYSTVITTRHYITVNGVYIFTAPYCTVRSI